MPKKIGLKSGKNNYNLKYFFNPKLTKDKTIAATTSAIGGA